MRLRKIAEVETNNAEIEKLRGERIAAPLPPEKAERQGGGRGQEGETRKEKGDAKAAKKDKDKAPKDKAPKDKKEKAKEKG